MRQRSAKPVELPNDQAVAGPDECQHLCQTGAIIPDTTDPILEQVPLVDASREKRVALEIQHLTVAVRRDPHVADQHVRKTSRIRFPYVGSFRHGLSCSF